MVGEQSLPALDREVNVLIRGSQNSLLGLTDEALTRINYDGDTKDNPTLEGSRNGLLAGHIVKAGTSDSKPVAVLATGADGERALGIVLNDALGDQYGSFSGVASGKCVYMHGSNAVVGTCRYETTDLADSSPADLTYAEGDALYVSPNGLPTKEESESAQVIGTVLIAPAQYGDEMVIQLA